LNDFPFEHRQVNIYVVCVASTKGRSRYLYNFSYCKIAEANTVNFMSWMLGLTPGIFGRFDSPACINASSFYIVLRFLWPARTNAFSIYLLDIYALRIKCILRLVLRHLCFHLLRRIVQNSHEVFFVRSLSGFWCPVARTAPERFPILEMPLLLLLKTML
jgi:hypothetical protein